MGYGMFLGIFRWIIELIFDHLMVTKEKRNISTMRKVTILAVAGLLVSSFYMNYHLSKKAIAYAKAEVVAETKINRLENIILDNYKCIADAQKKVRKDTVMNR